MTTRVVAVIQARMGSSRLHGKVLLPLHGRPVLGWVIRAARAARQVDDVVVATSTQPADDAIETVCQDLGVGIVRGSETDVVSRFAAALDATNADAVVRLTADCPLLDPALIDQVVSIWRIDPVLDYVSTTLVRTFPRGLDVELASRPALEMADAEAVDSDRVHVTSLLYDPASNFRMASVFVRPANDDLRVTLDVRADYELLLGLAKLLPDEPPSWRNVVAVLRAHPELVELNKQVRQRPKEEG